MFLTITLVCCLYVDLLIIFDFIYVMLLIVILQYMFMVVCKFKEKRPVCLHEKLREDLEKKHKRHIGSGRIARP